MNNNIANHLSSKLALPTHISKGVQAEFTMVIPVVPESVFHLHKEYYQTPNSVASRIFEDEIQSVVHAREETLQSLRELGPPDLVHLIKQPVKSSTKQVCQGALADGMKQHG